MKKNWQYKKLGEVCEIKSGYTPATEDLLETGEIPYFKVGDMNSEGNEKFLINTLSYLSYPCKTFPKDSIVFPKNGAAIGTNKKRILKQPSVVDLNTAILVPNKDYNIEFLYYYILNIDFKKITRRGAVPTLDIKELKSFILPYLRLSEQERIVAELDLLSGIMEKQKQQLKELDTLAQSIFYSMFGEENGELKNWEITDIHNCFEYIRNGANIKQSKNAKGLPITRIETLSRGIFNRERMGFADIFNLEGLEKHILDDNDLLMSHINSKTHIGKTVLYKKLKNETIIHGMNLLRMKPSISIINPTYIIYFFGTFFFKSQLSSIRKDAVNQSSFSVSALNKLKVKLPPLSLQNQFAEKIEKIEKQKEAINKNIEETQKLFDFTMDKYFG